MNDVVEEAMTGVVDTREQQNLADREARIERTQQSAYIEIGLELSAIREQQLYKVQRMYPISGRYSFETWEEYVEARFDFSANNANQLIQAATVTTKMMNSGNEFTQFPKYARHARALAKLETEDDQAKVWQRCLDLPKVTIDIVDAEIEKFREEKARRYQTLEEWLQNPIPIEANTTNTSFNPQKSNGIEWAKHSWNPVTGCEHDCPYCYARDLANLRYPQGFVPTIHRDRFSAPANVKVPEAALQDISHKNIFVCSMADLFGKWVPEEWIQSVLDVAITNQQWNYLFLTKFPKRMYQFEYPDNCWLGTSVDCQVRVKAVEEAFKKVNSGIKWLSIEPLLEPLTFNHLDMFDWIVIGGASSSNKTPKWVPPFEWIADLVAQARAADCRVYFKDNLDMGEHMRIKEFPTVDPVIKLLPEEFKYMKGL